MDNKQFTEGGDLNLPSGWVVKELGLIAKIKHGRDQKNIQIENGKYPILATGGEIGRTNTPLYTKPSVLIGRKGTIDKPRYIETPFWTIDTLFYTEVSDETLPLWLFYKFETINWYLYNEASGVPSLSASTISKIKIPLPTLPEQKAIAQVLSTMDKAIQLTNQLIAQKELRKKWLMQNLLTGKKLLRGYDEAWKEILLEDVFKLSSGETKPDDVSKFQTNEYLFPIYGGNGIMAFSKVFNSEGEKIIIGRVGEYCGVTRKVSGKYWITDNALYSASFLKEVSIDFLTYKLIFEDLSKLRNQGGQPLISQKPIYSKILSIPPIETQTAIAQILQAADKEIELLKAKAAKLKEQKRGMMQVLLTGKKRLMV